MEALKSNNESLALEAIESLRKHYTLYGVIILAYAGLLVISLFFAAIAGFAAF